MDRDECLASAFKLEDRPRESWCTQPYRVVPYEDDVEIKYGGVKTFMEEISHLDHSHDVAEILRFTAKWNNLVSIGQNSR